jgi:aryl-alcohol dehydrogenase-like predicted oxidoreductase
MVMSWGTWVEFQELLKRLATIGVKYKVSLTVVASRWVLQQPAVGAVIVGTRLGVSIHGNENLDVFNFALDEDDLTYINEAALGDEMRKSRALYDKIGDCGHEYHSVH